MFGDAERPSYGVGERIFARMASMASGSSDLTPEDSADASVGGGGVGDVGCGVGVVCGADEAEEVGLGLWGGGMDEC